MSTRKRRKQRSPGVMKMVRKPMPPPTRVEDAPTKYQRAREKARLHREEDPDEHTGGR
jgi:hypothetical protein